MLILWARELVGAALFVGGALLYRERSAVDQSTTVAIMLMILGLALVWIMPW